VFNRAEAPVVVRVTPFSVKNTPVNTFAGSVTSAVLVFVNVAINVLPLTENDMEAARLPLDPANVTGKGLAFAEDTPTRTTRARDSRESRQFFRTAMSIISPQILSIQ
jgi:hypothetical protein